MWLWSIQYSSIYYDNYSSSHCGEEYAKGIKSTSIAYGKQYIVSIYLSRKKGWDNMKQKREIMEEVVKMLENMDSQFLEHTYNIIKIMGEVNMYTCKDSDNKYEIPE